MMGGSNALLLPLLIASFAGGCGASDPIVMKPTKTGGQQVAVVMLQGAQIEAKAYVPLFAQVQAASEQEVWVALPSCLGNVVNPMSIGGAISSSLTALKKAGFSGNSVFYAGHSLGGAMLEMHAFDDHDNMTGVILMGSFIARKHRGEPGASFPVPVLTLSGELDGLARVTRNGAEAYQTQIGYAAAGSSAATKAVRDFPVVVMEGVSHMQYASGNPPTLVRERDLVPEVSNDDAHKTMAGFIAAFFALQSESSDPAAKKLADAVAASGKWLDPIIQSLHLEGFQNFKPPCQSDFPTNPTCQYPRWPRKCLGPCKGKPDPLPPSDCTCGSPWVMNNAQKIMAGFDKSAKPSQKILTRDAFEDVSDVRPFHLPHIFNLCTSANDESCVLNTTTVDMPIYEELDKLDTGFASISAYEQRVKLKSRQAMWQAAGLEANFSETDAPLTRCKEINQAALDWATKTAGAKTMERYKRLGNPYVIVDDTYAGIGITGPKWIKMELIYTQIDNRMEISAPTFSTENKNNGDEPYYKTVGYHYCKVLSPARVMEWIYVDSLRLHDSINNKTDHSIRLL